MQNSSGTWLRRIMGQSTRARLLRALLPIPLVVVLVSSFFYHSVMDNGNATQQSLFYIVVTLFSVVLIGLIVNHVAVKIDRDIAQSNDLRMHALNEALKSDRNFLGFMGNGPFTAFMRDKSGRYLYANQAFAAIYHKSVDEILGKNSVEIGFSEDVAREVEADDQRVLATGEKSTRTLTVTHMDGLQRHWYVVKFPHPDHAGNVVVGGISLDITERVKAEASKQEAHEHLLQAYKFASIGEMAGNIAHEINNPLAIIDGRSRHLREVLSETPIDTAMAVKFCNIIADTTQRLVKIVNSLRTMSRSSERDPFTRKSIQSVVDDTMALCAAKLKMNEVAVTVEMPSSPIEIDCRPSELSQVLINLISNAHDAVETHTERWIKVIVTDSADLLFISVVDSGPGVPADLKHRVTEPFFTTKSEGKGTGLGLSISKGFVVGHGGDLFLDDGSAHTTFIIRLPKQQVKRQVA